MRWQLKNLGIGILFEKEHINTLDSTGELLFTILSSLAQDESRNISENCKWGMGQNATHSLAKYFVEVVER